MPLPALPALASLFARAIPALVGNGELLSGLLGRGTAASTMTGTAKAAGGAIDVATGKVAGGTVEGAGGKATGGRISGAFKSLLTDLLGSSVGTRQPARETEAERESQFRRRTHIPSAADLFDYRPASHATRTASTAPAAETAERKSTYVPAATVPKSPDGSASGQKSISSLKNFGIQLFRFTGVMGSGLKLWLKVNTALYAGSKALETFVWGISESNRGLAQWNGSIAASFAQLDIAAARRNIQTGKATSGSTVALNAAYAALLDEMQPIREDLATMLNGIGVIAAHIGRGMAFLSKWHPLLMGIHAAARMIEEHTAPKPGEMVDPLEDFLKSIRGGMGGRPGPREPLMPIGPRHPLPPLI